MACTKLVDGGACVESGALVRQLRTYNGLRKQAHQEEIIARLDTHSRVYLLNKTRFVHQFLGSVTFRIAFAHNLRIPSTDAK